MSHTITSVAELEALYGEVNKGSLLKETDRIVPEYRAFIEAAPFVALATRGPEGLDCSPRGDGPGFVQVQDEKTLLLPDRRGNNRIDSLRNIVRDPNVALLFLIPASARPCASTAAPQSRLSRPCSKASLSTARRRNPC
jgi:predicted pyridoxine 5'-phosphate oxidase superfamily flavin-nucleotide-binding protein